MNTRLAICLAIVIAILFAPAANASSGALRRTTIKQCPNGIYYGIHGGDNHWHQAEQSNVSSGWSAVGDAFYYDPCPPDEVVYAPVKEDPTPAPAPTPTPEPEPAPEASPESDDGYIVGFTAEPLYIDQSSDNEEPATSAGAQVSSDTDSESDKQDEQEDDKKDKEIASLDNEKEEKRNDDGGDSWSSSGNDSDTKKKHGKGSAVAAGLVEIAAVAGGVYVVKKKKK